LTRVLLSRGVLVGFTMLCDVTSAVTEFMVRMLHASRASALVPLNSVQTLKA
jgi:hypothetical protein